MKFDLRDTPYGRLLALFYEPEPHFTYVRTDANQLAVRMRFKRRGDLPLNVKECAIALLMKALPMDEKETCLVVEKMLDEHSIVLRTTEEESDE